ncbi:MAG: hypothetical protein ACOY4T_13680 [Pseudomonadota bacterium]|jgi:formate-dependent nitrite reductase membrane component NrfD
MTVTDLLTQQLSDIFRWGLLVALVLTARNTQAATGTWLPLAAGVLFVAVIIPIVMTPALAPQVTQIGVGLVANLVILAVVLTLRWVWLRFGRRSS